MFAGPLPLCFITAITVIIITITISSVPPPPPANTLLFISCSPATCETLLLLISCSSKLSCFCSISLHTQRHRSMHVLNPHTILSY